MRDAVLFVQHDHVSPPSLIGSAFAAAGFAVETLLVVPPDRFGSPDVTATFPDPGDYAALVPMGAPWSVYDAKVGSWVEPELEWLRAADRGGVPVLGICFGGQLLATAHGGAVSASPVPEIGWHVVHTDDPAAVPAGPWFQWHSDRWTVPPGARELARNAAASQAFALRRNLAVQFHPELDPPMLRGWLDNGGGHTLDAGGYDRGAVLAHTEAEAQAARRRATMLVDHFVTEFVRRANAAP